MTAAQSGQLSAGQARGMPPPSYVMGDAPETIAFTGPASDGLAAARGWWWA